MTVLDFVRLIRTNLKTLVATAALGLIAAFLWTSTQPEVYSSQATGLLTVGTGETVGDILTSQSVAATKVDAYAPLVNTRSVGERIVEDLGSDDDPSAVAASLTAITNPAAGLIVIQSSAGTPQQAQDRANAAIRALADEAAEIETGGREDAPLVVRIKPMENAALPSAPTSPNLTKNLVIGLLAGLVLGLAFSALRRRLDARIRVQTEAEELTKASVIGVIPESSQLAKKRTSQLDRHSAPVEAMRHVRTNLRFVDVDNPPRSVVVTSAVQGEGKSTISSTLARILAEAGQQVVIVDADLRRPNVANFFGVDDTVGLTQVLAGDVDIDDVLQDSVYEGLQILTAGRVPPNPSELLGSKKMRAVIEELAKDHFVILDAPPLLPVTDAGLLATQADGALLVLRVGKTYKEQAALSAKVLEQLGARLLGVILNQAAPKNMGTVLYGHGYGYGSYQSQYGYGDERKTGRKARKERRERAKARRRGGKQARQEDRARKRKAKAEAEASASAEADDRASGAPSGAVNHERRRTPQRWRGTSQRRPANRQAGRVVG